MTIPPSRGRRKTRFVRDEPPPHDLVELVRACSEDVEETRSDIARAATRSADAYAIERPDGTREALYGVSVFAVGARRSVAEVLAAFSASPMYLAVTARKVRANGFDIVATGTNPAHFDIQLLSGVPAEGSGVAADDAALASRTSTFIALAGPLRANPAYAGGESSPEET